jgi:hypothetical protein
MWMRRSLVLGLCAAAVLAVGGCSQDGSYRLSWAFVDPATGATVSSATACGRYLVDSIHASGTDETGDTQQIVALCAPGWVTASAPVGNWTFAIGAFDAQGALIVWKDAATQTTSSPQTTAPMPVASEGLPAEFSVTFQPQ